MQFNSLILEAKLDISDYELNGSKLFNLISSNFVRNTTLIPSLLKLIRAVRKKSGLRF
jgi:hypothetical protein